MHRMPIGPMGADRKIPIDTQPTNMDIIVPKKEVIQFTTCKDNKNFFSFQISDASFND